MLKSCEKICMILHHQVSNTKIFLIQCSLNNLQLFNSPCMGPFNRGNMYKSWSFSWLILFNPKYLVEIKRQLDATDDFYCISYCLLNMFQAPLCPSSGAREYYISGCCLSYSVLWFSSCQYGVEVRIMCPVCRLLQQPANQTHNPQQPLV